VTIHALCKKLYGLALTGDVYSPHTLFEIEWLVWINFHASVTDEPETPAYIFPF